LRSAEDGDSVREIIVYRQSSNAGLMSGLFGCVFAFLAIFSFAMLFLPFAILFSTISLLRSISGLSATGFGAATVSIILTGIGFIVSPSAWLVVAGLLSTLPSTPPSHAAREITSVTNTETVNQTWQVPARVPAQPIWQVPNQGPAQPAAPLMTVSPPQEVPAHPQAYSDGLADRTAYENWIASLAPSERAGAEYWASQRSLRNPGPCTRATHTESDRRMEAACREAQRRLRPTDVRRLHEPEYRLGWNAFVRSSDQDSREPRAADLSQPPAQGRAMVRP
jgi:hypothetical protein